jgi:hypothetical protein
MDRRPIAGSMTNGAVNTRFVRGRGRVWLAVAAELLARILTRILTQSPEFLERMGSCNCSPRWAMADWPSPSAAPETAAWTA